MTIKAVLLDLDDTLLANPTQRFTERYLALLDQFLRARLAMDGVIATLTAGTRAVLQNANPARSNRETFFEAFRPRLPVTREVFDATIDEFYRSVYPQLEGLTQKHPGARRLITWLMARGYTVAVTTNPFYPRIAIDQRLAWAGLSDIPFALITVLENMHYAKPQPAYYEEVLARLGIQAGEAIMVGDDWSNDMVPAWQAGLNTFWVTDEGAAPPAAGPVQPDSYGTLADFACQVQEENWLDTLVPRPDRPEQIGPRLNGNLAALWSILAELPAHVWSMRPVPNEWSPIEVLCHLADSEREQQRPQLQQIVDGDNPLLVQPPVAALPEAHRCSDNPQPVAELFTRERLRTLAYLATLPPSAWNRPARHPVSGSTTLLEMANATAQHDRLHLLQLRETADRCLQEA